MSRPCICGLSNNRNSQGITSVLHFLKLNIDACRLFICYSNRVLAVTGSGVLEKAVLGCCSTVLQALPRRSEKVKFITGSSNPEVIKNGVLYLRISIPMIPPMAILVILRNILQGMRRPGMPLFCSCLELIGKVIFALWLVPAFGYLAVCICEPVTWVICCVVIAVAVFAIRGEFMDRHI